VNGMEEYLLGDYSLLQFKVYYEIFDVCFQALAIYI